MDEDNKVKITCKMCFGTGFLIYGLMDPAPCPRCDKRGYVEDRYIKPYKWLKLITLTMATMLIIYTLIWVFGK
jgi:hypothetical protein